MGEPCPAVVVGVDEASSKSDDDDDVVMVRPSVLQVAVKTASKKRPAPPPIRWNHVEGIRQLTLQRVRRGSRLSLMVSGARERISIMKSQLLAQKAEGIYAVSVSLYMTAEFLLRMNKSLASFLFVAVSNVTSTWKH